MFNLNNLLTDFQLRKILFLFPLILIYAFLLFLGDIQEDAYITIRTAFNLADHGDFSYNLGEDYSGATSYLYPFLIALIRLASGERAITIVLIVNAIALLVTTYYLSRIFGCIFNFSIAIRGLLWIVLSIAPASLLMVSRGMETPYVALLFVVGYVYNRVLCLTLA